MADISRPPPPAPPPPLEVGMEVEEELIREPADMGVLLLLLRILFPRLPLVPPPPPAPLCL